MPAGRRKRSDRSIPINQKGLWFSVAGALLVLLGLCLALRPSSPSEKSFQIGTIRSGRGRQQEPDPLQRQAGSLTSAHSEAQRDFSTSKEQPARQAGSLWSVAKSEVAETGHGVDSQSHEGDAITTGKVKEETVDTDAGKITEVGAGLAEAGTMSERKCHVEEHAEYTATEVVRWGDAHPKESSDECCEACKAEPECNVWVFCDSQDGCTGDRKFGECWLKKDKQLSVKKPKGSRSADLPWKSGAVYSKQEALQLGAAEEAREAAEKKRRDELRADLSRPIVYLDVAIKGEAVGRMEFVLFTKEAPLAAENFRALCTCEKGIAPKGHTGAGKAYCFKGVYFYRIIDQFINQAGVGTDSTYGGYFKDDPGGLAIEHDRAGLLSMAQTGPDTNDSHFSIMMNPAPHLNGKHVVFGELVSGWDVAQAINALSAGQPDNTAMHQPWAQITDSGQLQRVRRH